MNIKSYDLKSVHLPRLSGVGLRIFTILLETRLGRAIFLKSLLRNAGVEQFRKNIFNDPPTFLPRYPAIRLSGEPSIELKNCISKENIKSDGFMFTSVNEFNQAYLTGYTTPEEIAEKVIRAVDDSNLHTPPLRAVIAQNQQDVRAQAQASAARYRTGKAISIFDGVPVAIKDEFDQVPYPTWVGTKFLGTAPAGEDATIVAKMRAAGALLIGKCNMHEIGIGVTGLNIHHGTVRNPYNLMHHTGGSSSGPAAAVASGLSPVAIGADGGGSIRIPAGFCGIVGLKPTFARVSEYGAAPLCWSVAHNGPLANSAQDAMLAYAIIAGPDPKDNHTQIQPPLTLPNLNNVDLHNLILGVYWPWFQHATKPVVSICENMLHKFEQMGATVEDITLPELEAIRVAHTITIAAEMTANMAQYYRSHQQDFSLEVRVNLALAHTFSARDYLLAQRIRTQAITHFNLALSKVDVIITPTTACVAPPISKKALSTSESDISTLTEIMRFVVAANFTGLPAISFPAGYDEKGLPIGMQAIGRPWSEDVLLSLAHASENVLARRKPHLYYNMLSDNI